MDQVSGNSIKTFKLLSIGQRGVGKTVFLAGGYTELHPIRPTEGHQKLWFDCKDAREEEKIEQILNYVVQNGQYPPPTMKVTNFSFSLKSQSLSGSQTLSHFLWWDIPGEICESCNNEFRSMVQQSHGCCVFIDAYALLHKPKYVHAFEQIIEQVVVISNLVYLNNLKYPFAIILTKCDLLEPTPDNRQKLDISLQPLTTRLDAFNANYRTFYCFIPIVGQEGALSLKAKGAAAPFLWLVWELSKSYKPSLVQNLLDLATKANNNAFTKQPEALDGSLQSLLKRPETNSGTKKIFGLFFLPSARKWLLVSALAIFGLVGVLGLIAINQEWISRKEPKQHQELSEIQNLRQRGQFKEATSLMEKLLKQEPARIDLRLQVADLYEITGQIQQAEKAYDQVLKQQPNNVVALTRKALLRRSLGDRATAQILFSQAEQAAPTEEMKSKIRSLAQKTMQSSQ